MSQNRDVDSLSLWGRESTLYAYSDVEGLVCLWCQSVMLIVCLGELLNRSGDETSHLLQILDFPLCSHDVGQFSCYLETKIMSYMFIILSCDKTACKRYIKKIK